MPRKCTLKANPIPFRWPSIWQWLMVPSSPLPQLQMPNPSSAPSIACQATKAADEGLLFKQMNHNAPKTEATPEEAAEEPTRPPEANHKATEHLYPKLRRRCQNKLRRTENNRKFEYYTVIRTFREYWMKTIGFICYFNYGTISNYNTYLLLNQNFLK